MDNHMRDLHQPQLITRNPGYPNSRSGLDLYNGPIPINITYSVKVVQAKNVQFEDSTFAGNGKDETVHFFSTDFNVLSLDSQDPTSIGHGKINTHGIKRIDGAVCPF